MLLQGLKILSPYPTTFRSLKRCKNRSQPVRTKLENADTRILGRSNLCSLIWS